MRAKRVAVGLSGCLLWAAASGVSANGLVIAEPGITFEKPDGWVLIPGLLFRQTLAQPVRAAVAGTGLAAAVERDLQNSQVLVATAISPLGTRGNFVVTFEKAAFSPDHYELLEAVDPAALLEAGMASTQRQFAAMPGTEVLAGPTALTINGRAWQMLRVRTAWLVSPQKTIIMVTEIYYTLLDKALLRVVATAIPEVFQAHEQMPRTIVNSVRIE